MDDRDILLASQCVAVDLHLGALVGILLSPRLVEAEHTPGRVIELVVVQLGGEECRVEGQLQLRSEGCELKPGHGDQVLVRVRLGASGEALRCGYGRRRPIRRPVAGSELRDNKTKQERERCRGYLRRKVSKAQGSRGRRDGGERKRDARCQERARPRSPGDKSEVAQWGLGWVLRCGARQRWPRSHESADRKLRAGSQ